MILRFPPVKKGATVSFHAFTRSANSFSQDFRNFALNELGERYKDNFEEVYKIVNEFTKDNKVANDTGTGVLPGQTKQISFGKGTNSSKWKIQ